MSVPPGIVEDVRQMLLRKYDRNSISVERVFITLPGGYVLKGHFHRGHRPNARARLYSDTKDGAKMTYPSLVIRQLL